MNIFMKYKPLGKWSECVRNITRQIVSDYEQFSEQSLSDNFPYSETFCSVFSRNRSEYREALHILS